MDWADEEAAAAQLTDPWLKPKLPLWNATFNISYQRFRHRVAQIADLNHSRVEGAVRAEWDQIPDGALVLPVDDDDWFAPDAARVLEAGLDPGATGYVWDSHWIEVPINLGHRIQLLRRRLMPSAPPRWLCGTNNYAMVKDSEAKRLLANHVEASRWFEQRPGSIRRVDAPLSVANRTLASQTSLGGRRHRISRSELLRKYRRYRRLYTRPVPDEVAWCRPCAAMMAELMGELEIAGA